MPLIGLLFGLYYPLVPLSGVDNLWRLGNLGVGALDPQRDYLKPMLIALQGWIALYAVYLIGLRLPLPATRTVGRIGERIPSSALKPWAFCFLFGSMAFEVYYRSLSSPFLLKSAVHFGLALGHLGLVLLVALSVQRRLSFLETAALYGGFAANVFLQLSSGATWKVTYIFFSYFLGRWIVRRHFGVRTLLAGVAAILFFTLVRGAMADWRDRVWYPPRTGLGRSDTGVEWGERSAVVQSMLMVTLLERQIEDSGFVGAARHSWSIVARRATLDLFADVVRRTPGEIAYWNGDTYHSLIGFAIPRFLWPDKPQKTLGQDFGHRYAYLADDDIDTSINLPFLVEFYINFGENGVLWGMCLAGLLFAVLERYVNQSRQSLLVTLGGGALFFPLLNIENDFALQFGGLFLYAVALRLVGWGIALVAPRVRRHLPAHSGKLLWPRYSVRLTISRYLPTKVLGPAFRRRVRQLLAS